MYNYISCIHLKIVLVISIYETMTTENGRLGVELVWGWNTFMLPYCVEGLSANSMLTQFLGETVISTIK